MISWTILRRVYVSAFRNPDRLMLSLALPTNPHTLLNLMRALSGLVGAQDFKSISVTSYTPLGWCVGFLGAFLRVLIGRVIAVALSRSRLLDPSQSAEDLGLSESDEDTWPECVVVSIENTCET